MTVSSTANRVSYNCNGSQTVFVYNFKIFQDSDLKVILTDSDDNETTLALNSDYTVSGACDKSGGSITTTQTYASGNKITILRELELKQETNYEEGGSFPAESHENALDKLTMICQQFGEAIGRALKLPVSSQYSDLELPNPEADKALVWNAAGTALINAVVASVIGASTDLTDFPSSLSGQAGKGVKVKSDASGWEFTSLSSDVSFIQDADGDTKLEVEKNSDEDRIRGTVAGAEAFLLETTGILTLAKQSRCSAYQSTLQALAHSTETKILFQTEHYDNQNEFSSSRFTADEDGVYAVKAQVSVEGLADQDASGIMIFVNGSKKRQRAFIMAKAGNAQMFLAEDIELNAGDYIEIYASQSSGAPKNTTNNLYSTFMSIHKLS